MEQQYINQMEREQEYSTGEREYSVTKNVEVDEWEDTLEEANN